MKKHSLFNKIISMLLIIILLITPQVNYVQASSKKSMSSQSSGVKKDRPAAKKVKNEKPVKIPYGILKNEDLLEKWSSKKELIEKRTSNSKTYQNEDGSNTTLLFLEPIHIKADKDNSKKAKEGNNNLSKSDYLEINNTLTKVKSSGKVIYQNTLGLYDVQFATNNEESIHIQSDGITLKLIPQGLDWSSMEVSDNQVYVPSKTEGITYMYTVDNTSLKEDIVLDYQTNKETYTYELDVDSKYNVTLQNNIIYVKDKSDKKVYYTVSAPYMTDREGNVNHNITLGLKKDNGSYKVTLSPDQKWLKEATRAYPVVIDPTIQISQDSEFRDTYVEQNFPNTTQFDNSMLFIGYDDGVASHHGADKKGITKSYFKLTLPDELTEKSTIESATLKLHAYTNWSTEPRTVVVKEPQSRFTIPSAASPDYTDCITWDNQPTLASGSVSSTVITGSGDYSFNIKPLVTGWINGDPNYGFALQMQDSSSQAEAFYSAQGLDKPYIEIKYENEQIPEPDPESDEFKLVLKRDDIYENGIAFAKNSLVWNKESDSSDSDTIEGSDDNVNRATITYTLMPDGITGKITKENFTEFDWETKHYDLEKDKAYWIKADIKVEQWVESETAEGEGDYQEVYSESMSTKKFVVAEAQPGDTLKRLAKHYVNDGTKSDSISSLNKLTAKHLFVGQKLFIMTKKETPYNYDQPDTITSQIMVNDANTGSLNQNMETVGQYINPVTGAFNYYNTDFDYPVYNSSINFTRSYVSSLKNRKSALGDNWDYNYNKYLIFYKDGKIGYNIGDGTRIYYTKSGDSYTTTAPTYDKLIQKDDKYQIITKDKTVYTFNASGLLTLITDSNENKTNVEYDDNDWQTSITDALEESITIQYYDSDTDWMGNIKSVKLPDASSINFSYDEGTNQLISYLDAEEQETVYTYNANHRLEKLIQPEENAILTNHYTSSGKISEQVDGEENHIKLTYSSGITIYTDGENHAYQYQYDSKKRLTKKTYPDSTYEAFEYNDKGDILNYTDPLERIHQYTYNSLGYITSYIRPEDKKTYQYIYKDDYLLTETIDFKGNKTTTTYDDNNNIDKEIVYITENGTQKQVITDYDYSANGLLNQIKDPDGVITQYDNSNYPSKVKVTGEGTTYTEYYDKMGRVITSLDAENNITSTTYDKNGNVLAVKYPSDGDMNRSVTYSYDRNGNLISETSSRLVPDAGGYANTDYTYDGNNRIKQIIDPYNEVITYGYDANGNNTSITDQEQNVTTYQYNSNNLLKAIYQPDESEPAYTYEYDALCNEKKVTEADGDYTEYQYNYKVGEVSKIINPENNIIAYTYDDMGNILTESYPDSTTQYTYDSLYQTINIVESGEASTSVTYNNSGRISEIRDEKGINYIYHYDSNTGQLSNIIEEVIADSSITTSSKTETYRTEYTYDALGNIKTIKDKEGNITTYQYNELNEVSKVIDPMNKVTQYEYDEDGNVSKTIDPEGNVTLNEYDALNQLYQVIIPEADTTETYLYNSRGYLDRYIDPMGNITTYTYDKRGRESKIIDANGQETKYQYYQDDTLKKIVYPNGEYEEYTYDGLNQTKWYKDRAGVTYDITYTASGNTDSMKDSVGNTVDYRYDNLGRLTQVEDTIGAVTTYSYDNFSRLSSEKESDGNVTTYQYDPYDHIIKMIDPELKVTEYTYNASDHVTKVVKPGDRAYSYDYDSSGNLTKVTDPLGNTTSYKYNNNNQVSEITNPRGFSKKYQYNALNQVKVATDERDYTTKYEYYSGGLLKSVTDALNNTTSYTYNAVNLLETVTNALNETTTYHYDFFGNTTNAVDSRGAMTSYSYDSNDQVLTTYDTQNNLIQNEYYPNGDLKKTTDQEGRTTEYVYDAIHRLTKTIEPNGLTTTNAYDEITGDLKKVYDNAGQATTYTYDKMHRLLSETDIQGLVTSYTYDDFGNLSTTTTPDGNTTTYGYDELDRITSILDPESNLTEYAYDPVGNLDYEIKPTNLKYDYSYDPANNLEKTIDPLGQVTSYSYNGNNNVSTMSDPAGNKYSYNYDALNRLLSMSDLTGSGSRYNYDASGNISSFTDGNGNTTNYQYNNLNQLASVKDAEGNLTKYTYYKDGSLKSMTDARGNTSNYTYDASGNLQSFTNPKGEVIQYQYNLLDQIDKEIKADGNSIDYTYDQYNRLESIQYPDKTSVKYTYDKLNRKISMENENGITEYAYDSMSRLTGVSNPNSEQVSYEYDDKGRKTSVIYPDGKYVDYQYDEYDRIIAVNDREGRITRYTYDESGRKKTTTLPNGITTTYDYDKANRIIGITSVKENGTNVLKFTYEYDAAGNRILEEIWQGDKHYKREYTYYKNNTVKSMHESGDNDVTYAYVYDENGNISEKKITKTENTDGNTTTTTKVYHYTYDSANRMTTQSEEGGDVRRYRYDANGNRIARVINADSSEENSSTTDSDTSSNSKETADYYYYDYEGRLIEIVLHNGKVFTYGYDGEGNRLWRTYSQYPLVKPPVEEGEQVEDPATFPGYNKDNVDSDTSTSDTNTSDIGTTSDASSSETTTDKKKSNSSSENETQSNEDVDNSESNTNNSDKDTTDDSSTINDDTENVDTNTDSNSNIGTSISNNNNFIISNADLIDIETEDDTSNELVSILSIQADDELVTTVDSYLSTKIIAKTENSNGNGNDNSNGNSENNGNSSSDNGNGNSNNNGNGNNDSNNNGNGNSNNGNSSKDDSSKGNGNADNSNGNNNDKDKGNNSGNDKSDAWKDNGATIDQEKANGKTKQHSNSSNGYDKNLNENGNGYAYGKNKNKNKNNNGKNSNSNNSNSNSNNSNNPNTSDEVDLTNPEIFEVTNYINDINQEYTQVLMTTDIDGNYRGAYTYADGERISVEDLGQVEGVPNDPLYYLYDALGSTIAITNMNAGIIDNNRFAPYGEALSPVAKNSRLTNSPWGYTGESHDIEAGLVYLRARYYEPGTARFIQQDSYPYFGEVQKPLTRNLYIYGNANPMIFTDPGGHYSVKEDKVAHEQFQIHFTNVYGKNKVFTDFPIYKSFLPSTMTKKADLVLSKRGAVEVYEIEAYNKSKSGKDKLSSNVNDLKNKRINAIRGTTYKRLGKKLKLSYPGNSKKEIEYFTKPSDDGMIYYKIVDKEKTGNEGYQNSTMKLIMQLEGTPFLKPRINNNGTITIGYGYDFTKESDPDMFYKYLNVNSKGNIIVVGEMSIKDAEDTIKKAADIKGITIALNDFINGKGYGNTVKPLILNQNQYDALFSYFYANGPKVFTDSKYNEWIGYGGEYAKRAKARKKLRNYLIYNNGNYNSSQIANLFVNSKGGNINYDYKDRRETEASVFNH